MDCAFFSPPAPWSLGNRALCRISSSWARNPPAPLGKKRLYRFFMQHFLRCAINGTKGEKDRATKASAEYFIAEGTSRPERHAWRTARISEHRRTHGARGDLFFVSITDRSPAPRGSPSKPGSPLLHEMSELLVGNAHRHAQRLADDQLRQVVVLNVDNPLMVSELALIWLQVRNSGISAVGFTRPAREQNDVVLPDLSVAEHAVEVLHVR